MHVCDNMKVWDTLKRKYPPVMNDESVPLTDRKTNAG